MPSDARLNTGLAGHHKTKKLMRRLGPAGPWGLVCLFLWAAANRTDGDLAGMSAEDIELAADWGGEPDALVTALREVGFLDGDDGDLKIHDWAEHNPWAAGAEDRAESSRWAALCKRYGRAGAAERMPDYAARMRPARDAQCEPHAPLPSPSPIPSPLPDQKQKPAPRAAATFLAAPDWLDPESWAEWCQHRKSPKWKESGQRYSLAELHKLFLAGNDPVLVIRQSIAAGWTGLFALKNHGATHEVHRDNSAVGRVEASIQRNRAARGEAIDGEAVRILRGDPVEPDGGDLRSPVGVVVRG